MLLGAALVVAVLRFRSRRRTPFAPRRAGRRVGTHQAHHGGRTRSAGTGIVTSFIPPRAPSLGAVVIPHLLAAHSTAPPEVTIVLLGAAVVAAMLRFRSRRGGGRGPFGGGYGRSGTGRGGSTGESNSPSDL